MGYTGRSNAEVRVHILKKRCKKISPNRFAEMYIKRSAPMVASNAFQHISVNHKIISTAGRKAIALSLRASNTQASTSQQQSQPATLSRATARATYTPRPTIIGRTQATTMLNSPASKAVRIGRTQLAYK